MAKNTARITAMIDRIIDVALCISHFTCRPYLVLDKKNLTMSPLTFSWGKATIGTLQSKKSHSGFQPCFTLYTNSFSGGTSDLTR